MKMKRKVEKTKKYIALLLSALMVLCLFAGCGTQESETSEPPAAESADPVETAGAVETFCATDNYAAGALAACSAITGAGADVDLYSVNGGPEAKAKMLADGEEGVWRATSAQQPIKMGETICELAYQYLAGEELESEYLIDAFIISPANIEEYAGSDWQ